jgi:hypothetical protein
LAAAIAVVALVAAWRAYDYWENRRAAEAGAAYDVAASLAEEGKHGEAEAAFAKLVTDGTSGYRVLAQLREAAAIAERDPKAAVAAYDKIAGAASGQPMVGELATIRAAFLLVDTAPLSEMTGRLEPLSQPSGAFRHTARELLALSAWRNRDTAAMQRWTEVAKNDPEAPSGLRSRMDVLASLVPEAGKP